MRAPDSDPGERGDEVAQGRGSGQEADGLVEQVNGTGCMANAHAEPTPQRMTWNGGAVGSRRVSAPPAPALSGVSAHPAERTHRIVLAVGTRPEAIKMAPVYQALQRITGITPLLLLTGQHREQLQQALALFDIPAAANLDVMTERQSLPTLAARLLPRVSEALEQMRADYVVVHGDTLTTFVVAWAAFLAKLPVAHVEAGLRSHSLSEPFPEEANRRLTDVLADLWLPPTAAARENLLREGVPPERIVVTGQTGIDAVLYASRVGKAPEEQPTSPYIVVTLHRRENWPRLPEITRALARVAERHPELQFVYPVHLNPAVREGIAPEFAHAPNVRLLSPLEYGAMAALLRGSLLIVTDSGGLQEEGPALRVPVLVVREVTERPEGVAAGALQLVGTDPHRLEEALDALIGDTAARQRMSSAPNPFGDGRGGERAAQAIAWRVGVAERPQDWVGPSVGGAGT